MDSGKKAEIKSHVLAIAKLLYSEIQSDDIKTLADIEKIVRAQVLEHVIPDIGILYPFRGRDAPLRACQPDR